MYLGVVQDRFYASATSASSSSSSSSSSATWWGWGSYSAHGRSFASRVSVAILESEGEATVSGEGTQPPAHFVRTPLTGGKIRVSNGYAGLVEGDGRCHVSARWSGRTVGNVSCDNICLTGVSDLGEAGITADDRTGSSGLTAIGG